MRQMLQYPPVSHILGVLVLSKDEALATSFADELADMLRGTDGLVTFGTVRGTDRQTSGCVSIYDIWKIGGV